MDTQRTAEVLQGMLMKDEESEYFNKDHVQNYFQFLDVT